MINSNEIKFIDRNQSYQIRNSTLFPHDITVQDCREAILDVSGFRETTKQGMICFNYDFCFKSSFPNPDIEPDHKKAFLYKVRRECRGIIFNEETGEIICRKLHKFFNINEQEETKEELIKLNENFVLLEKLDGSLIAPILYNNKVLWGSKSGVTDLTIKVEKLIEKQRQQVNAQYNEFAHHWMSKQYTPMFEYCGESNQIVLYYPIDSLKLICLRHMITGEYLTHDQMIEACKPFNIPIVESIDIKTHQHFSKLYSDLNGASTSSTSLVHSEQFINTGASKLLELVQAMEHVEGYILKFDSGKTYKMKSNWYFEFHSIGPNIKYVHEKDVWELILNENGLGAIDDLIAKIATSGPIPERYLAIQLFGKELLERIEKVSIESIDLVKLFKSQGKVRKNISADTSVPNYFKKLVFQFYDDIEADEPTTKHVGKVTKYLIEYSRKFCSNATKLEEARKLLNYSYFGTFKGSIKFNEDKQQVVAEE